MNYTAIDLASLAWLLPELDSTFKAARKQLADARSAQAIAKPLLAAKQSIHEAAGALQVINAQGVVHFLECIEHAIAHCATLPHLDDHAYTVLDEACYALFAYLNELHSNGSPLQPVVVFAYYEAVCLLDPANDLAKSYHPVQLYFPDLNHRLQRTDEAGKPLLDTKLVNLHKVRNAYEALLLKVFKGNANDKDLDNLSVLLGIVANHSSQAHAYSFWKVAQAVAKTLKESHTATDLGIKRWLGRLNLQIERLAAGSSHLSERLFREALFYIATRSTGAANQSSLNAQVTRDFALTDSVPPSYIERRYGNAIPVSTTAMIDQLLMLKLAWDEAAPAPTEAEGLAVSSSMLMRRLRIAQQMGSQLQALLSEYHLPILVSVVQSLVQAAQTVVDSGKPLHKSLGIEGAKAILWLEETIKHPGQTSTAQLNQAQRLIERLNDSKDVDYALPVASAASQHSTQQLMAHVIQEAMVTLSTVEKQLDDFFRVNQDAQSLRSALAPLAQTSGALEVIGLPQAALATRAIERRVLGFTTQTEAVEPSEFLTLAVQFSQVTELLNLFKRAPERAQADFVFDPQSNDLKDLRLAIAPIDGDTFDSVESLIGQRRADAQALIKQVVAKPQDTDARQALVESIQVLRDDAALTGDVGMAQLDSIEFSPAPPKESIAVDSSIEAAREASSESKALAQLDAMLSSSVVQMPVNAPLADSEDDLYAIFLEEAHEVLLDLDSLLHTLETEPESLTLLTDIRRGFHTLKGSSRMVGFKVFGDAAWHVEQVVNTALARQSPASIDLIQFMRCGQTALSVWLRQLDDTLLNLESSQGIDAKAFDVPSQLPSFISQLAPYLQALERGVGRQALNADSAPFLAAPVTTSSAAAGIVEPLTSNSESNTIAKDKPKISLIANNEGLRPQDFIDKARSAVLKAHALEAASPVVTEPTMPLQPVQMAAFTPAPAALSPAVVTDNMVSIGPLRLPKQLFAIYTQEASQHIAALRSDLNQWKMQAPRPSSEDAFKQAHSLKGSAATVGFAVLKDLAAPLEQVLQLSMESAIALSTADLMVIDAAIAALGLMIDKFIVCEYPAAQLLHIGALKQLHIQLGKRSKFGSSDSPPPPNSTQNKTAQLLQASARLAANAADALALSALERRVLQNSTAAIATAIDSANGAANATANAAFTAPLNSEMDVFDAQDPSAGATQLDDTIVDEIDDDIWQDFVHEADAIMPKAQTALLELPHAAKALDDFRRDLHTLKGSARMAGAMRLGALVHQLESTLEKNVLLQEPYIGERAHVALLNDFDDIAALYAGLKKPALSSQAQANPVPESMVDSAPFLTMMAQTSAMFDDALSQPAVAKSPNLDSALALDPVALPIASTQTTASSIQALPKLAPRRLNEVGEKNAVMLPALRMRTDLLDHLVNQASEMASSKGRLDRHVLQLRSSLIELTDNVERLRKQLREIEIQAESQMANRVDIINSTENQFDPLEFDRFTRFQELTRMLTESLNDMLAVRDTVSKTLLEAERDLAYQTKSTKDLTQSLMRSRLVAFDAVSDRLYRLVRQTARELGKQVALDIQGGHLTLDRSILERITSGLEHLVRNSVVHGIELPAQRLANHKAEQGTITILVKQQGNELEIIVSDDGTGLPLQKIHDIALAKGLVAAQALPTVQQLAELIFTPGFSTADAVTELAGRGIGMDVVRSDIIGLGGRITLSTSPQHNTRFSIRIPLTLAINQVLMVVAQEVQYAIPSALIQSVVSVKASDLAQAYSQGRITQRDNVYPFAHLSELLNLPTVHMLQSRSATVILLSNGSDSVAIHVDSIIGNQESVVKPLSTVMLRIPGLSSATLLNDGTLCLILDPVQLSTNRALNTAPSNSIQPATDYAAKQVNPSTYALGKQCADSQNAPLTMVQILSPDLPPDLPSKKSAATPKLAMVIDDSLTVRKVTQKLLLREGWDVLLAKDGIDALEQLQTVHPSVLLVDIEMPRMDGFDLTRNVRADERLKATPIIIITSRIADKHRDYAFSLGVNAYMGKPYRDDELLAEMTKLTAAAA